MTITSIVAGLVWLLLLTAAIVVTSEIVRRPNNGSWDRWGKS